MDCLSVIKVVKKGCTPKSVSPEHRAYGILVQPILQATAPNQLNIAWTKVHPEKARKANFTRPDRPPIPRSDWTRENYLNVLADLYSEPNIPAALNPTTIPLKIVAITVFELLNTIMPLDSLYWQKDNVPAGNALGATSRLTAGYQRASTHDHYPATYWPSSKVGLLPTVLDRLTPGRNVGHRAFLLGFILDQIPHGRSTNASLKRTLVPSTRSLTPLSTYSSTVNAFKRPGQRFRKRRSSGTFLLENFHLYPRRPCLRRFDTTCSCYLCYLASFIHGDGCSRNLACPPPAHDARLS
jgi:hypothetical protein